jgi:hypothetical protein
MTYGPPCPFRSVGFTWRAGYFPLSRAGQAVIAEHNGVPMEKLPRGARNSSSAGMHRWVERLGHLKTLGLPHRHESGRLLLPAEIGL